MTCPRDASSSLQDDASSTSASAVADGVSGAPRVIALIETEADTEWAASLGADLPATWSLGVWEAAHRTSRMRDLPAADVVAIAPGVSKVEALLSGGRDAERAPVVVAGLPTLGHRIKRSDLRSRRGADLLVVHSSAERRRVTVMTRHTGLGGEPVLASLPKLLPDRASQKIRRSMPPARGSLVFAVQPTAPATRAQRRTLVESLAAVARSRPDEQVVLAVDASMSWENQRRSVEFVEAALDGLDTSPNLVLRTAPMRTHLAMAGAFATINSAAIVEAIAAGVPSLAIGDLGPGAFVGGLDLSGSGLVGSTRDLLRGDFRAPSSTWCSDNYFHPEGENTIAQVVARRVEDRTSGPPLNHHLGMARDDDRLRTALARAASFVDLGASSGSARHGRGRLETNLKSWTRPAV